MGQFRRFVLVGTAGFGCDAGLAVLFVMARFPPMLARALAIAAAVALTFALNRRFTFRSRDAGWPRELSRYVLVSGLGAGVNYAVFGLVLAAAPPNAFAWGIVAGSAAALAFNFLGARRFAFSPRPALTLG